MANASGALCAHQTSRGYGCLNPASGGPFCPGHDPRNQCQAPLSQGGRCKRRSRVDGGYCALHAA